MIEEFDGSPHSQSRVWIVSERPSISKAWRKLRSPTQASRAARAKHLSQPALGYRSASAWTGEALDALDKRAIAVQVGVGVVAGWLASWFVGGSGTSVRDHRAGRIAHRWLSLGALRHRPRDSQSDRQPRCDRNRWSDDRRPSRPPHRLRGIATCHRAHEGPSPRSRNSPTRAPFQ